MSTTSEVDQCVLDHFHSILAETRASFRQCFGVDLIPQVPTQPASLDVTLLTLRGTAPLGQAHLRSVSVSNDTPASQPHTVLEHSTDAPNTTAADAGSAQPDVPVSRGKRFSWQKHQEAIVAAIARKGTPCREFEVRALLREQQIVPETALTGTKLNSFLTHLAERGTLVRVDGCYQVPGAAAVDQEDESLSEEEDVEDEVIKVRPRGRRGRRRASRDLLDADDVVSSRVVDSSPPARVFDAIRKAADTGPFAALLPTLSRCALRASKESSKFSAADVQVELIEAVEGEDVDEFPSAVEILSVLTAGRIPQVVDVDKKGNAETRRFVWVSK